MAAKGNRGRHGHTTRTSVSKIQKADETARALKLKRAGMSFRDISRIMEIAIGKAHGLVDAGLKAIPELERQELTTDIVEREYGIIKAHWPKRAIPDNAKIIQASHKTLVAIFGLEAPKGIELSGGLGIGVTEATPEEAARLVREAFGSHAARQATNAAPEDDEADAGDVSPPAPTE